MEKTISELKIAFDAVSLYIERHTSKICPSCTKVCCIDKHCHYEKEDLIFINAIGLDKTAYETDRKETDPCRFLKENGCSLPRYRRPFRCTWYFCERLLESMQGDSPKEYRAFVSAFEYLQRLRQRLLERTNV